MNAVRCHCLFSVLIAALAFTAPHSVQAADDVLPGTQKLELNEPFDEAMVRGIGEFAEHEIALSRDRREALWHRDYSSHEAYEKSIAPNRERLKVSLGVIDQRVSTRDQRPYSWGTPRLSEAGSLTHERREVLEGVTVESVTLNGGGSASLIYIPDADHAPEEVTGHQLGVDEALRIPRRLLAELNISSTIPVIISRSDENSGTQSVRFTNQTQREFLYRNSFELGRHLIGYEVQKILAVVDARGTPADPSGKKIPLIVWGHGEGGLLALHAAAVDPRIDVCIVSGYFEERENVWREPIYRNVWRQLSEFGDAEVASLIAPRQLIIEACTGPNIDGPPAPRPGRSGGAAPGVLRTPPIESVEREFARTKTHYEKLGAADKLHLVKSGDGTGPVGASETFALLKQALLLQTPESVHYVDPAVNTPSDQYIAARQKRQCEELRQYNQRLMHVSDKHRDKVWAVADRSVPGMWQTPQEAYQEKWKATQEKYREMVYDELIGRIPYDLLPPNARTRKIIDEPTHTGYEVVLDVWEKGGETRDKRQEPGKDSSSGPPPSTVFASGILLIPKDLEPGRKRPVVVCQHGLEGVPADTISEDPKHEAYHYYKGFSSVLVKRGFIVYAPQNPYRGQDKFRVLQRKSNPLGRSLFSYIVPQHQQTLNWLASLPFVDADRIAFYGLSYGGKTAVRVPPMLPLRDNASVTALMKEKGWTRLTPAEYWVFSKSPLFTCDKFDEQQKMADVDLNWAAGKGIGRGEIQARGGQVIPPEDLTAFVAALPSHDFSHINYEINAPHIQDDEAVGSTKWFETQLVKAGCRRILQSHGGSSGNTVLSDTIVGSTPTPGYCLSICSADFDEWILKIVTTEDRYSYMFTGEYEIFEWNMAHIANYAELSSLMTPRPFMVERGHEDGVAPDEWVGWEFYKVKRHYDKLGIGRRTEIEVFDGPHTINGVGTYKFLHKHLNWSEPKEEQELNNLIDE